LKLNGTFQLLVYADVSNILGVSVHTVERKKSVIVASKVNGLNVNDEKTKHMVM
jgi:hypothetical protein